MASFHRNPCKSGEKTQRLARGNRKRHGQPRDRQTCRRVDCRPSGTEFNQGCCQRSRCFRVLGLQERRRRTARLGRESARGRLHCPAPARPARRTRENRTQSDRCRTVPARRKSNETFDQTRCCRRRLRQCRRRRLKYGIVRTTLSRFGIKFPASQTYRGLPRKKRGL